MAIALRGMSPNWAVWGSCAMVSPPAPRIARTPSVPSEPAPEKRMQIARLLPILRQGAEEEVDGHPNAAVLLTGSVR